MSLINRVHKAFCCSIELKEIAIGILSQDISRAGEMLAQGIRDGHKILSCGNGGSACDAQHFTGELVNRFQIERGNLPAISLTADLAVLTAISNDYGYQEVFAHQIKALGGKGDVLLAISTSGCSKNVICAINEAHKWGMKVIALTGDNKGVMKAILNGDDIEICVPSNVTARVQEVHILIIHCLCDLIDHQLFEKGI